MAQLTSSWFSSIAASPVRSAIVVAAIALIVRLICIFTVATDYTLADGIGYHNLAVNLAHGNGYSASLSAPYEPYFFREPLHPVVLAGVYSAYELFGGHVEYLHTEHFDLGAYPAIVWARIVQALIGVLTCVIFLRTLRLMIRPTYALLIAVAVAAYIPLAVYSGMLMRETLHAFTLVLLGYTFARFVQTRRLAWMAATGLAWAAANMVLQVTSPLGVVILILALWLLRDWKLAVGGTVLATAVMMAAISPWLLRTYVFHPDVRVFKSLGVSLTHEGSGYAGAVAQNLETGRITQDSAVRAWRAWYALPEKAKFQYSFDGTFDEWARAYPAAPLSFRLKLMADYVRRSWIESFWVVESADGELKLRPHLFYRSEHRTALYYLSLGAMLLGYLAIPGIVIFGWRLLPILLPFLYMGPLMLLIGNESRRALPIHPYLVMFALLAVAYLWLRLIRKRNHASAVNGILLPSRTPGGYRTERSRLRAVQSMQM